MAANRHGTNGLPFLFLQRAALALHSTVYLNTWRHPRGGGIAPDPLKLISSQASERGNCLMKMDHGDGFTFHFVTAGIRLYYSQPSPLSSSSHTTHSGGSVYSLCILDLVPFFSGKAFACVYVFASWMLKSSHGVKKPAWLAMSTGKCREKFSPVPAGHIVPGLAAVCGLLWNDVLYQHWMSQALHIYGIIGLPTDGMERNGSLVSFPPYLDGILPGMLHAGSRMDQCRWRCPVRMLLHVGAQLLIGG